MFSVFLLATSFASLVASSPAQAAPHLIAPSLSDSERLTYAIVQAAHLAAQIEVTYAEHLASFDTLIENYQFIDQNPDYQDCLHTPFWWPNSFRQTACDEAGQLEHALWKRMETEFSSDLIRESYKDRFKKQARFLLGKFEWINLPASSASAAEYDRSFGDWYQQLVNLAAFYATALTQRDLGADWAKIRALHRSSAIDREDVTRWHALAAKEFKNDLQAKRRDVLDLLRHDLSSAVRSFWTQNQLSPQSRCALTVEGSVDLPEQTLLLRQQLQEEMYAQRTHAELTAKILRDAGFCSRIDL